MRHFSPRDLEDYVKCRLTERRINRMLIVFYVVFFTLFILTLIIALLHPELGVGVCTPGVHPL